MEMPIETDFEISQVGLVVDNTIKTRYLFEINKGSNKIPDIDVNAAIPEDELVFLLKIWFMLLMVLVMYP